MPYIRTNKDCEVVDGSQLSEAGVSLKQPGHYDVSQEVSKLSYENFNKDYVRVKYDGSAATQPNILSGWNADYLRVFIEKADHWPVAQVAQYQVQQTKYVKSGSNCDGESCEILPHKPYQPSPLVPAIDVDNDGFIDTYDKIYFIIDDERALELEQSSEGRNIITFEEDTEFSL